MKSKKWLILDIDPIRGNMNSDLPVVMTESFSLVSLGISGSVAAIWAVEEFWGRGLCDEKKLTSLKFPRPEMSLLLGFFVIVVFISENFCQQKADLILVKIFIM